MRRSKVKARIRHGSLVDAERAGEAAERTRLADFFQQFEFGPAQVCGHARSSPEIADLCDSAFI